MDADLSAAAACGAWVAGGAQRPSGDGGTRARGAKEGEAARGRGEEEEELTGGTY